MMIQIDTNVFWYEPAHILISWDQFRSPPAGPAGRYYWENATLILTRFNPGVPGHYQNTDPAILFVNKMRGLYLSEYKLHLDLIFEEYELVDDGWRGRVRVSDAELTRWLLMCGS